MDSNSRGPLPLMKTLDDAVALCEKENDNFYVTAFMIEAWLGELVLEVAGEYAEKKQARDRNMQKGQAWRGFQKIFGHASDEDFPHILGSLHRFAQYEDAQAEILVRAIVPLSFEHECLSDFIGPKTLSEAIQPREFILLARRSTERWCDWIDAIVHFQTHASWHLSPTQFDPDPERRELAALGVNQRLFSHLSPFGKAWWQWHHDEAAERFKDSPKWTALGQAMASTHERPWNYPEVDELSISLWPLLKRYNWTYRDLLNVVRSVVSRPEAYPCQTEQEFSTYCVNVLGLRKTGKGRTTRNGKPEGWEVVMRLSGRDP